MDEKANITIPKEVEQWYEPSAWATVNVHFSIFDENKQIINKLSLHCIPGCLVAHSDYFRKIIGLNRNIIDIEIPESFTYHMLWKGSFGVINPSIDNIKCIFDCMHSGIMCHELSNLDFEELYLAKSLECNKLYNFILSEINTSECSKCHPWLCVAIAEKFDCENIIKQAFSYIHKDLTKQCTCNLRDEHELAMKTISIDTYIRFALCKIENPVK